MQVNVIKQDGQDSGKQLELAPEIFEVEFNQGLVHQAVTRHMAGARAGTKAQKTRSEVRGGGSKPWRQKGTGRARAGTINSPIWRTGGVTFAAKPRDYSKKLNKKMYRLALKSVISELLRNERLVVIDELNLQSYKTKDAAKLLSDLKVDNALIIVNEMDDNLNLSTRNIVGVEAITVNQINPVNLIKYKNIVATEAAMKQMSEVLV